MSSMAVGIDLGTTYCCVAVLKDGHVEVINNDMGNRVTPSHVAFTDSERLVGEAAKGQAHRNGQNTIYDAKRLIGRKFSDDVVTSDRKLWPFTVIEGQADKPLLRVQHEGQTKTFAPQQISSMLLARLKKYAEDFVDMEVTKAVITVPAYFNDSQKSATIEAGKIAGLDVLRIISEPVAAALTYGLQHQKSGKKKVLIYDLGGGTCDVSILEISGGQFNVLAKAGDTHLGGEDFDKCLVDHLLQEIRQRHKKDLSGNSRAQRRLHGAAEHAKRTLSSSDVANVEVEGLVGGDDFYTTVTCACFEHLCEGHFQRCMKPVTECLDAAGLQAKQIDEVVLVGGSTRIPRVQSLLQMLFDGKILNKSVNPDEAVAYGAAVQAAMLTGGAGSAMSFISLQDVTPLSLGLSCHGDKFSVVIPRNTKIPAQVVKSDYETAVADATDCSFPVHEGERALASANNRLGDFSLRGLPKGPKGSVKFEVTFSIDDDGILTVKAKHIGTDNWKGITIAHNSGRHTPEELMQMIQEAKRFRMADEEALKKHAAKNLLVEYKNGVQNALRAGMGRSLLAGDVETLTKAVQRVTQWLDSESGLDEARVYYNKRVELEDLCETIMRNAKRQKPGWRISKEVMLAAGKGLAATIATVLTLTL